MNKQIIIIALSGALLSNFAGAMDKNNVPSNPNTLQKQNTLKEKDAFSTKTQKQATIKQKTPQKTQPNFSTYSCLSSKMLLLKDLDAIG